MSTFRTVFKIPQSSFKIEHKHKAMLLGSCFSDNIGDKLISNKFNVCANPYGVIYNPYSVQEVLQHILGHRVLDASDFSHSNNLWHSFLHHSSFSEQDQKILEQKIEIVQKQTLEYLQQADYLFITFGTAWVYQLRETRRIVANCHKLPDKTFQRFRLSTCDITDEFSHLIRRIEEINPKLQIIFTISPIRHLRDGAIENQLSKSILTVAIHELIAMHTNCSYYPSYELVMDDLRDYRFYAQDMTHLTTQTVDYIFDRFSDTFFNEETRKRLKDIEKITQALAHRPFSEHTITYKTFLLKTKQQIEQVKSQEQAIDWTTELQQIDTKLHSLKDLQ